MNAKRRRRASSFCRLAPQQSIANNAALEISMRYQMVIRDVALAANLAAFTSACSFFVAAVRGVCNPTKSVPAMPKRNSGTGFFAAEMKEYDA
jgi:hypothetical protein